MSKKYVIQWKSKINGRAGKGTKQFSIEEAESLVHELNQEYPNIHHEVLDCEAAACTEAETAIARETEPTSESPAEQNQPAPATSENENDKNSYQTHAFSE